MSCSIGMIAGGTACSVDTEFYSKENFDKDEWLLLKARSGLSKIRNVCARHKLAYLSVYEAKQTACCNPFNRHLKAARADLRVISKDIYLKSLAVPSIEGGGWQVLIPGKKICKRCYTEALTYLNIVETYEEPSSLSSREQSQDLFAEEEAGNKVSQSSSDIASCSLQMDTFYDCGLRGSAIIGMESDSKEKDSGSPQAYSASPPSSPIRSSAVNKQVISSTQTSSMSDENVESSGSVYNPIPKSEQAIKKINLSLGQIGESPVTKRKLTEYALYVPQKLKKIEDQYAALMAVGGASNVTREDSFKSKIMDALIKKFQNSETASEKIMVLSVALSALTHREVLDIFEQYGATDHLLKKTSSLMSDQGGLFPTPVSKKGRSLPDSVIKLVDDFYNSDNNTYQLPGKKDCLVVRINGEKVSVPKKLILCGLRELYALFKTVHPLESISFSKFAKLKPKHCVIAGSPGTHTVCVCRYHQNFKLMIEGGDLNTFQCKSDKDFIYAALCEKPTADCFLQSGCPKCPGVESLKDKLLDFYGENFVEEITYNRWSEKERSSLDTVVKPMEEFVSDLLCSLKELLPHHYIAKKQAQHLDEAKKNLKEGEVLTICDFSENYSFLIQESAQSYYWSNDQATLHPFASYYLKDGVLHFSGFIVISDCMKHVVQTFYAFQRKFIAFMKTIVPNVHKIIYFSDGAAQQYKNMYNMINQTYHEEDFNIASEWNFFASYHGKGPSDGLGGRYKSDAGLASTQKVLIRNPRELYNWGAARTNSAIKVDFVTIQEVEEATSFLQPRFAAALPVKGIRSLHSCIPAAVGELSVKRVSLAEKSEFRPVQLIRKVPEFITIQPGDFITIQTGKQWQLAQVSIVDEEAQDVLVTVLKRSQEPGRSKTYFYSMPSGIDEVSVSLKEVLTGVKPHYDEQRHVFVVSSNDQERTVWQLKSALL